MTGLLRTVPAIPTFGTWPPSYPCLRAQNPPQSGKSDSEDDSIRLSQPTGWDGWHGRVITDGPGLGPFMHPRPGADARREQSFTMAGDQAGRLAGQPVAPIFATNSQRDGRDDTGYDPSETPVLPSREDRTLVPRGAATYSDPAERFRRAGARGPRRPVCPRYIPAVRYVPLSLAILPCQAIWQVLAHPSRPTARMYPLRPAIQAIPTFGTCGRVLSRPDGV
jgi:hypothetical protein